jgi:hypothetical protein
MSFARILSYANAYFVWLYAAGLVALLLCLNEIRGARKSRAETIFSLEKELATARERRARTALVVVLVLLAMLTVTKFALIPTRTLPPVHEPTATSMVIEPPTSISETPTPTRTRIPTRPLPTPLLPTETPTSTPIPPPPCPQPGVCITSPIAGQVVKGQVIIRGTAKIERFQFYKVEYGIGEEPQNWHSIGEVQRAPVVDGVLATWDTTGFPAGVFKLRLTVVDISGNFPPPYEVRVVIQP